MNLSLKREFCKAFAADPQRFINRWITSQSRDLDIILGTRFSPWISWIILLHAALTIIRT